MAETNFERARMVADSWPEWKRTYVLTKDSTRSLSSTEKNSHESQSEYSQKQSVNVRTEGK